MKKQSEADSNQQEEVEEMDASETKEEEEDLFELDSEQGAEEKKKKTGILFLQTIPPYMTVTILREMLGQFGEIGRVFLQEDPNTEARYKKVRRFCEGWVEFKSKKKAKWIAQNINSTRMSQRKKSKFYDYMWSLKYLPRFKWAHLSERLAYERAVHRQRMRTEISQAKKEATHFQLSLEKSNKIQKLKRKQKLLDVMQEQGYELPQKRLDSEHRKKNNKTGEKEQRAQLLTSLFGADKK